MMKQCHIFAAVMLVTSVGASLSWADGELAEIEQPTLVQLLEPSTTGIGHGASLAIDGDSAVVGTPNPGGYGVADVYRRQWLPEDQWSVESLPWYWEWVCRLKPVDEQLDSRFGQSVAISGDTVVVGAWKDDRFGFNAGGAWVFQIPTSPSGTLLSSETLTPSARQPGDYFGWSAVASEGLFAIGGWGADVDGQDAAGSVWVFERSGSAMVQRARLSGGSHAAPNARFGSSLDMTSTVLAVGAPSAPGGGGVHLFEHQGDGVALADYIPNPEGDSGDAFGASLSIAGSDLFEGIVVGAPGDGELGPLAGTIWLFEGPDEGVVEVDGGYKQFASDGGPWHQTGSSVVVMMHELGGGTNEDDNAFLLFGSPGWRESGQPTDSGAIHVLQFDQDDDEEWIQRVDLPILPGASMGSSLGAQFDTLSPLNDLPIASLLIGSPGVGGVLILEMPFVRSRGDCDGNELLDELEMRFDPDQHDCDEDGVFDACQIDYDGGHFDCDGNNELDSCEIEDDPSLDCDMSDRLDSCEIADDPSLDCDQNGELDWCEIESDPSLDCDMSGQLDSCEIANDPNLDCDENGQLDTCEIANDPSLDTDGNGVLDVCEGFGDPNFDCDDNGISDADEIANDPNLDCNLDGVLDSCHHWMTEEFDSTFGYIDLSYLAVRFEPTGMTDPAWTIRTLDAFGQSGEDDVWIDSTNHTVQYPLSSGCNISSDCDDAFVSVPLPFPFDFDSQTWNEVYVGTNGYVTFGIGDSEYVQTLEDHFSIPRLSALWLDLDPSDGGEVRTGLGPGGSFVVTWFEIPEFGTSGSFINTAQLILHPDHNFEMVWLGISSVEAIVGPSLGEGIPVDFVQTDLSNAWDGIARPHCWEGTVEGDQRCLQDVIVDGTVDVRDLLELLRNWGPAEPGSDAARCDFAPEVLDEKVSVPDLMIMLDAMRDGCEVQE